MEAERLNQLAKIKTITIPVSGIVRFIKKLFGGSKDETKRDT